MMTLLRLRRGQFRLTPKSFTTGSKAQVRSELLMVKREIPRHSRPSSQKKRFSNRKPSEMRLLRMILEPVLSLMVIRNFQSAQHRKSARRRRRRATSRGHRTCSTETAVVLTSGPQPKLWCLPRAALQKPTPRTMIRRAEVPTVSILIISYATTQTT